MNASSPGREWTEVADAAVGEVARAAGADSPYGQLGAHISGPLAFSFLRWLESTARADGGTQLWFAAREGELLLKCAQAMGCAFDGRYLPVSRQALWRCVQGVPRDTVPFWIIDSDARTIRATLLNLGWEANDWSEPLARHGFAPESFDQRLVWTAEERARLLRFLQDSVVAARLESDARAQLAGARACFAACGLIDGARVGFVDLGWGGTIQDAWQQTLAAAGLKVDVVGYYLALESSRTGLVQRAMEYDPVRPPFYLQAHHTVIESLFPATHGQITGYRERDAEAECASFTTLPVVATEQLHEGAVAFCRLAIERRLDASSLPLRPWLEAFVHWPARELATRLAAARFNSGITAGAPLVRGWSEMRHVFELLRSGPLCEWPGGWLALAAPWRWLPGGVRGAMSRALIGTIGARRRLVRWVQTREREQRTTARGGAC